MSGTNILMNCSTLAIHIFAMVISLIILALIIYRFHYNKLYRRQISSSPFDDQISLILIVMSVPGFPTLFFLFQFIITGEIHPFADRTHELCVSINALGFTFGFSILNSFTQLLPPLSADEDS
ncbi:unnamed protein product, partial [Adineta steineri]